MSSLRFWTGFEDNVPVASVRYQKLEIPFPGRGSAPSMLGVDGIDEGPSEYQETKRQSSELLVNRLLFVEAKGASFVTEDFSAVLAQHIPCLHLYWRQDPVG